jgi:hypothetical protein
MQQSSDYSENSTSNSSGVVTSNYIAHSEASIVVASSYSYRVLHASCRHRYLLTFLIDEHCMRA